MDGSKLEVLEGVKGKLIKATALAIMGEIAVTISDLLVRSCSVYKPQNYYCYANRPLPVGDKLWWADQASDQIGTCDKKDGGNWKVLRNNTSPMMHMRIYDEDVQKGEERKK